jgi:NAD dependent epimerase/dehydratase family enzyme
MVSLVKIVIPGGSGHLGHLLARSFARDGHDVAILSRRPVALPWRVVLWDAVSLGAWTAELEQADVLINLAGRSVNCRYTPARRRERRSSTARVAAVEHGDDLRASLRRGQ